MFDNKLMSGKKGLVMGVAMTDQFLGQLQKKLTNMVLSLHLPTKVTP